MSSTADVWNTPEIKEFLKEQRSAGGEILKDKIVSGSLARTPGVESREAYMLFYARFLVIAGMPFIEDAHDSAHSYLELLKYYGSRRVLDSSSEPSDSDFFSDLRRHPPEYHADRFMNGVCPFVHKYFASEYESITREKLFESEDSKAKERFNRAVVAAKYFQQSCTIRKAITAAKLQKEDLTNKDFCKMVKDLKKKREPFGDALFSTMSNEDSRLSKEFWYLRNKVPPLKNFKPGAEDGATVSGACLLELLEKAWEKEMLKDSNPELVVS